MTDWRTPASFNADAAINVTGQINNAEFKLDAVSFLNLLLFEYDVNISGAAAQTVGSNRAAGHVGRMKY